jgi:hypothetical protein
VRQQLSTAGIWLLAAALLLFWLAIAWLVRANARRHNVARRAASDGQATAATEPATSARSDAPLASTTLTGGQP